MTKSNQRLENIRMAKRDLELSLATLAKDATTTPTNPNPNPKYVQHQRQFQQQIARKKLGQKSKAYAPLNLLRVASRPSCKIVMVPRRPQKRARETDLRNL